jgi:hypothetical protein
LYTVALPAYFFSENAHDSLFTSDSLEEFDESDPNLTLLGTSGDDEKIWSEINDSQTFISGSLSEMRDGEPATEGSKGWHTRETVLHRILAILQSQQVPPDINIFSSTPDHDTLVHYFLHNTDPNLAFYVVNIKAKDPAVFSRLLPSKPKLGHDWGPTIAKQTRYHLVAGRWVANERTAPPGTTAILVCRGADFKNCLKKLEKLQKPFERKLKPWR